jgi:hypothetical protein
MANISPQHVQPLTMGFVGLLVLSLLGLGALNKLANK